MDKFAVTPCEFNELRGGSEKGRWFQPTVLTGSQKQNGCTWYLFTVITWESHTLPTKLGLFYGPFILRS